VLLAEHGARLDVKNQAGQTPLAITTTAALRGVYQMQPAERQATAEIPRTLGATE
jgi:hypothetical protein